MCKERCVKPRGALPSPPFWTQVLTKKVGVELYPPAYPSILYLKSALIAHLVGLEKFYNSCKDTILIHPVAVEISRVSDQLPFFLSWGREKKVGEGRGSYISTLHLSKVSTPPITAYLLHMDHTGVIYSTPGCDVQGPFARLWVSPVPSLLYPILTTPTS